MGCGPGLTSPSNIPESSSLVNAGRKKLIAVLSDWENFCVKNEADLLSLWFLPEMVKKKYVNIHKSQHLKIFLQSITFYWSKEIEGGELYVPLRNT